MISRCKGLGGARAPRRGTMCCEASCERGFARYHRKILFLAPLGLWGLLFIPEAALAAGPEQGPGLLAGIGISIFAATVLAYGATLVKQPLILAYVATGMVIGPHLGLGLIQSRSDIQTIAEIGLILLLFIIGLELDLKRLRAFGKSLMVTGVSQFLLCFGMGILFFRLLGFTLTGAPAGTVLGVEIAAGPYDVFYLGACFALSSTAIVVKLLYEKFELATLAGRITLGVLVFQDLWAMMLLGLQPNLKDPAVAGILWSFGEVGLLVALSFLTSRYLLGKVFQRIAKLPELVLVASLGWCCLVCGTAYYAGLSVEMGALIAGASISTFPYNLDIISKIVGIRDFFVTLFFVGLGMLIPNPLLNPGLMLVALIAAALLVLSRFLSVFPVLYFLDNGHRVSLLSSLNLSQMSEFSLVIAALGAGPAYGHISQDILTIVLFTFVITSVTSTYMIKYSDGLQKRLSRMLSAMGIRDIEKAPSETAVDSRGEIVFLGLYREGSSMIREIIDRRPDWKDRMVVIDYNPSVYRKLQSLGVAVVYGDVSNMETLRHAGVEKALVVVSSIPDSILVGTNNLRLLRQKKRLCPQAAMIASAENVAGALELYREGADFVLLPRLIVADHALPVLESFLAGQPSLHGAEALKRLHERGEEVVPI